MTDAGASAAVAGISAIALEALGVSPYGIAMACIGAVMFQAWSPAATGRLKAMLQVIAGGLIGAVAGQAMADTFGIDSRSAVMLASAFFRYAYYYFFDAVAKRADTIVDNAVKRK